MNVYGVQTQNMGFVDTSKTLRGAKAYATRNGYNMIGCRPNSGYYITQIHQKINGKWVQI